MELKELNHAGEQGVFGSLRVLGDIDNKNIKTIKRDVNVMQNVQTKMNTKINNYWTSISDDGIINIEEKQALKREWETIQQTYAALLAQATAKALISTSYWQDYQDAYDDLEELIFVTEKVFDDMYNATTLTDTENFNDIFHAYYYSEQFVQLAIMSGLIDKLGLRGLESLTEPGVEGELAFYRGELYQYHNNAWVRIGTESYMGMISTYVQQLDEATEGNYFLASGVFYLTVNLIINGEQLYINDDIFCIKIKTKVGKIYSFENGFWHPVKDSDPRYMAILADYMSLTGQVPNLMLDSIEEVVREPNRNPKYLGVSNTDPFLPKKGDYYVYSGITTSTRVRDRIYRYDGTAWEELSLADFDVNSRYYMNALQDILTLEEAGDGYFSTLFCNAFFTNKASINALKVQTIYLEEDGAIQSNNETYSAGEVGLRIDADGNIDANGDTHIGGTCTIDGNTTISGNAIIAGQLNGATGTLSGNLTSAGFEISGVEPGNVLLKAVNSVYNDRQGGSTHYGWKICGSGKFRLIGTWNDWVKIFINTQDNIVFDHWGTTGGSGTINKDITISAGDVIHFWTGSAGGAIGGPGGFVGGIYTKYQCGLLTFLGTEITDTSGGGGR
jgi:hypothetical protein